VYQLQTDEEMVESISRARRVFEDQTVALFREAQRMRKEEVRILDVLDTSFCLCDPPCEFICMCACGGMQAEREGIPMEEDDITLTPSNSLFGVKWEDVVLVIPFPRAALDEDPSIRTQTLANLNLLGNVLLMAVPKK
jgi:hypothetical protein